MAEVQGLPEVLDVLRWRWRTAALIAVLVFVGATIYVETLPSQYDGEAVVAIGPRPTVESAGADTVRVVGPKYVAYAEAPATIREVATELGEDGDTLQDAVNASIAEDTGNVTVTVRLPDASRAARAANEFAEELLSFSHSDPLLIAQVIAPAVRPAAPASPPRRLLEAASLIVGSLLGVAVSLLLERGRPRLRSWRDIARITGYPVVGRVPASRMLRARALEAFSDPATGSAFRTLRANLEPQLRELDINVIAVTSAQKGDGKTTVAALLAESLARLDMQVLLVDADLRRPRLGRLVNLPAQDGLSAVLKEEETLEQGVQPGWTDGLSVLPTAPDHEAGDLLARRFADVLADAAERFDVIVVDTPPLLATDDARTIARAAKGVLLVVSAGTMANAVNEAVLAVEALKSPLLGIVGNRLREAETPYY